VCALILLCCSENGEKLPEFAPADELHINECHFIGV